MHRYERSDRPLLGALLALLLVTRSYARWRPDPRNCSKGIRSKLISNALGFAWVVRAVARKSEVRARAKFLLIGRG